MAQMKEQNKTPEKELNKGDKQLTRCRVQTLVIRMLSELSENYNSIEKHMETIKKKQT